MHAIRRFGTTQVKIEKDPDQIIPVGDYVATYGGDFASRGHKRIRFQGEECVIIPGKRRWTLTTGLLKEGVIEKVEDDGYAVMDDDQMSQNLEALFTNFVPVQATGLTLDAMLASGAPSSSSSSGLAALPAGPQLSSASVEAVPGGDLGSFRFETISADSLPTVPPQPAAPSSSRSRRGTGKNRPWKLHQMALQRRRPPRHHQPKPLATRQPRAGPALAGPRGTRRATSRQRSWTSRMHRPAVSGTSGQMAGLTIGGVGGSWRTLTQRPSRP